MHSGKQRSLLYLTSGKHVSTNLLEFVGDTHVSGAKQILKSENEVITILSKTIHLNLQILICLQLVQFNHTESC